MTIAWNNDDKPVTIRGNSCSWTDDGAPLPYTISYCPGQRVWRARFEGSLVCCGTLHQCMAACEAADHDAKEEELRR